MSSIDVNVAGNCTICQEPNVEPKSWFRSFNQPTKDKVHTLACGHKFHLHCIQEGVNEQIKLGLAKEGAGTCPNCRQVTNLTSSTSKIASMLGTASIVCSIAASLLGIGITAAGTIYLGLPAVVVKAAIVISPFVSDFLYNKMLEHGLCNIILRACIGIHNWRTGLELKMDDLNAMEIASEESHGEVTRNIWIHTWEHLIDDWGNSGLTEYFDPVPNISEDQRKNLLAQAYEDMATRDPATFAGLKNHPHRSDEWLEAFMESGAQLVQFNILIPKEVI